MNETKPDRQKTLRERNLEKAKVDQAESLKKSSRTYGALTLLLFVGFGALIGIVCVASSDADADKILLNKRESKIFGEHMATLRQKAKEISEEVAKVVENRKLLKPEDCQWKFAQDYGASSDYGDIMGAYDETKCPPQEVIQSASCRAMCNRNQWSKCRQDKFKELGIKDTTCKWWAFSPKVAVMELLPIKTSGGNTDLYISQVSRCYMHHSWENYGRLRNFSEAETRSEETQTLSHIDVGIQDCMMNQLVEQWLVLVNEAHFSRGTADATRLKAFTSGACYEPYVSYGRRNKFYAEIDMVAGEYAEPPFEPYIGQLKGQLSARYKIQRPWCDLVCSTRVPPCLHRMSDSATCALNSRPSVVNSPSDNWKDWVWCQKECEKQPTCMAWNWNKFGQDTFRGSSASYVGDYKFACKLYKTAHYKDNVVDSLKYQLVRTNHFAQLYSAAGMRGCEPTDVSTRHYVKYKTTPKKWLACGVVAKDVEMTGVDAKSTETGVADWKSCAKKCTEKVDCQVWSFVGSSCSFFDTPGTEMKTGSGIVTGGRNCNDFCDDGYDLETSSDEEKKPGLSDPAACRDACAQSATCERFAWTVSTKQCRLLSKVTRRTSDKPDVVSGPWHCAIRPKATCPEKVSFDCEYMRRIWKLKEMPWADCAAHCKADPWCKFWAVGAPANGGQPCYLYDTDAGRKEGGSTEGGSVQCQADTADDTPHNVTKLLTKPFRRPFVSCIHQGMKLLPKGTKDLVTNNWQQCADYCESINANVSGLATETCDQFTIFKTLADGLMFVMPRQGINADLIDEGYEGHLCTVLNKDEAAAADTTAATCDVNYSYGEKGCKSAATAQAQKHYPAYHASFIGFGCHSQRCVLGEINGDHVVPFVDNPKDCVIECRKFTKTAAKTDQVYVLTYSPGYRTCYCAKGGNFQNFFPDPNGEFLAYALS